MQGFKVFPGNGHSAISYVFIQHFPGGIKIKRASTIDFRFF